MALFRKGTEDCCMQSVMWYLDDPKHLAVEGLGLICTTSGLEKSPTIVFDGVRWTPAALYEGPVGDVIRVEEPDTSEPNLVTAPGAVIQHD